MKSSKMSREGALNADSNDVMRKAVKLTPNKKSGKEKHTLYKGLNQFEDDEDQDIEVYTKKESILDYFDDDVDEE